MNSIRLLGIILVIAGIFSVIYGGFTYTKDRHEIKLGSMVMSVNQEETQNIPLWAGLGILVAGGVLLVAGSRK